MYKIVIVIMLRSAWMLYSYNLRIIGTEVLTEVVIEISNFWNLTLCIPLKQNPCFGT
jgi:hypothetical protein